jgi:phosphatidylglycerophosphate synthase
MIAARLCTELFGRRYRAADDCRREDVYTLANGVTVIRAAVAAILLVAAIVSQSHSLLLAGLATSMSLDFADGQIARFGTHPTTTLLGAQLDGLADRLAAVLVAIGVVSMNHDVLAVVAAAAVWLQFGIVDQFLSAQFLRFGLWSPDHFHAVDVHTWRMNWSAPAKVASNLPLLLLAIGSSATWAALGLALALAIVRLLSVAKVRMLGRELEELDLCRSPGDPRPAGAAAAASRHGAVEGRRERPFAASEASSDSTLARA